MIITLYLLILSIYEHLKVFYTENKIQIKILYSVFLNYELKAFDLVTLSSNSFNEELELVVQILFFFSDKTSIYKSEAN